MAAIWDYIRFGHVPELMRLARNFIPLYDHLLRGHNILPPVVMDPVPAASHAREVIEPPLVVRANFSTTPFSRADDAYIPFKVGEVQLPVVALTFDRGGIVPFVILLAIGREMDVPARRFARCDFFVLREAFP